VTVAEEITITAVTSGTAVAVAIDPAPAAMAATLVADYWDLQRVLSPEGLDLSLATGKESTTRLSAGLKTRENINSLGMSSALSMILDDYDPAFWRILHVAAITAGDFFAFISKPGGSYVWGNSKAGDYNRPGQNQTTQKATLSLMLQDDWASPERYKYMSVTDQATMTTLCKLAGLPLPV
jgi:hypothetical protein